MSKVVELVQKTLFVIEQEHKEAKRRLNAAKDQTEQSMKQQKECQDEVNRLSDEVSELRSWLISQDV